MREDTEAAPAVGKIPPVAMLAFLLAMFLLPAVIVAGVVWLVVREGRR